MVSNSTVPDDTPSIYMIHLEAFNMKNKIILVFPLINDIISAYESFRRDGQSREEAVKMVLVEFAGEDPDTEDDVLTWIGLAMAMGKEQRTYRRGS